jgi:YfiH family protein
LTAVVTGRELDFGRHTDTPAREVAAAYGVLHAWAAGRFDVVIGGSQVHGARLFHADGVRVPEPDGRNGPATVQVTGYDGFLASRPGVLLTVGVADCVPAFLAAPERTVVALLHAGWRGVAAGIVPRAVEVMAQEYGVGAEEIRAWWGPAIGPCCYPVGSEVVGALQATTAGTRPEAWLSRDDDGGTRVDLRGALTVQAEASGVRASAIASSPLCTACDGRLHSYRRERGGGGRMLALAGYARQGG